MWYFTIILSFFVYVTAILFSKNNFSVDAMREAAALFEGYHDFRTFMGKTKDSDRLTRREIHSIKIIERKKQDIGVSTNFSWPTIAVSSDVPDSHVIVDVYVKGKGFLYKQVRIYFVFPDIIMTCVPF